MRKLLRDILTETDKGRIKYSQGRFYLFVSFVVFFFLNIILAYYSISSKPLEEKETLVMISSNLRWALGMFALYVLGGKGVGAYKDSQTGISNNYSHEANYHYGHSPYNNPNQGGYPGQQSGQSFSDENKKTEKKDSGDVYTQDEDAVSE